MRVLVTGSGGRVGRRLTQELIARGHEAIGFDKGPGAVEHVSYRHVQGSLEDAQFISEMMAEVDAVVHLAALMSWVAADAPDIFKANVFGTFNLLEAASRQGINRFLFASSGEVCPETKPKYLPLDEHHPTQPATHYGMSKLLGEDMVWFYARKFGLQAVVLRFSHTQDATELLDPNSFFSGPRFFLRARIRQQEGFGNHTVVRILKPLDDGQEKLLLSRGEDGTPYRMPFCDTRDLVHGLLLALESPKAVGETIYLGTGEAVSFDEAIGRIQEITGLPVVEARLPGPAVNYITSNAKAKELLGFAPSWSFHRMLEEAATVWRGRTSHEKG